MPKTIAAPVFLQKTYSLFEEAPANVATWAHQGRTVVVKDPQELARTLLPQYFKHCNFASFVRQLNFYGFRKYKREEMLFGSVADNIEEEGMQYWWEFYHPNFVRDEPSKMTMIRRKTYSEAPPTYITAQPDEMGMLKKQVSTLQTQYTQLSNQITNLEMLVKTLIETHKRMPPAELKEPITKKVKATESILIDTEPSDMKIKADQSLTIDTATIDDVLTSPEALSLSLPSSPLGTFDFPIDESSWWPDDLAPEPNSTSAIDDIIYRDIEPPKLPSPPRCSMQADRPLVFRFTLPALKMASWEDGDRVLSRNTPADIAARKRVADEAFPNDAEEDGPPVETEENKEEAVVKPKKKRNVFSDQHLLSTDGFRKVYETFPKHFTDPVPAGMEAMALRDLMTCYKEWAFDLYPKLAFEDFVERTETLAKKAAVGELLQELRATEAKRGEPEPDFASIVENTPSTRITTDADPTEQEMQDILEYEAMIASMRQESATANPPVATAAKDADSSDGEAEFDYQPASSTAPPETNEREEKEPADEPQNVVEDDREQSKTAETEADTELIETATATENEAESNKPTSPIEETQVLEDEEEIDVPSDEEARDVMEYEARTSLLRDMVEKPSGRVPRASEALNEAATLLEEESDSDSDIEFPSTRFGSVSQATQPEDHITNL